MDPRHWFCTATENLLVSKVPLERERERGRRALFVPNSVNGAAESLQRELYRLGSVTFFSGQLD